MHCPDHVAPSKEAPTRFELAKLVHLGLPPSVTPLKLGGPMNCGWLTAFCWVCTEVNVAPVRSVPSKMVAAAVTFLKVAPARLVPETKVVPLRSESLKS